MQFVSGVGKTNVDLIYSGLPRIPLEGEELFATGFALRLGGGVPATLINLARLGVPAKLATLLGDDLFSGFAAGEFQRSGVSPVNLRAFAGEDYPLNVTTAVLTQGERTFISYGKEPAETEAFMQEAYRALRGAAIVEMHAGFLPVYRRLKEEGTLLVLDMGWDDEMSLEKYRDYLSLADYYTPNQKEALKITAAASPAEAAQRLSQYFERVIVKLDKDGCLILEGGEQRVIPNIPEFHNVDSTGAGDAFLSGFIYGLFHGSAFDEAVLYGNITGGKCVTGVGCLTEYVREEELHALARKYRAFLGRGA